MSELVSDIIPVLNEVTSIAGNIANYKPAWEAITNDAWVLDCVEGLTIPFITIPVQKWIPRPFRMSEQESKFVDKEIQNLLKKGVLKCVCPEEGQWISNIFLRPKANGKFRMILDLTILNKNIEYQHFKMFNLKTALDLIKQDTWMASADLSDAYYSLPIQKAYKKYLRFEWRDFLYEYQVLPNGLAPGPRYFTKLLKPVYSYLGELGHVCFPYIDDSFIMGNTEEECCLAVKDTKEILEKLGFKINEEKSELIPSHRLEFLGFIIDSERMTVSLTSEKIEKFNNTAKQLLVENTPIIRNVAALIGLMVAYTPGVEFGAAHYKFLETDKIKALRKNKGDFEKQMWVSKEGKEDIYWWLDNLENSRQIRLSDPDLELFTDASLLGWGAHTETLQTGGKWHESELAHINVLELKAILFGLKSLCRFSNKHIKIRTDSTTALAYVKNMGGTKSTACMHETKNIWTWAQNNNCWLTIAHVPGVLNVLADLRSRCFRQQIEWSLSNELFDYVCKQFGTPDIDLFASRLNHKLQKYVSWEPDPDNWKTDAFSFVWTEYFFYCFPPFRLLPRVCRKLERDNTRAIVIAPLWTCQLWLALLKKRARRCLVFPKDPNNLIGQGLSNQNPDMEAVKATKLMAFLFWHIP